MKYLIDRHDLPYDAFVADPSWLCPIKDDDDEGGRNDADAETEELQTDKVHGEGQPVR